MKIKLFVKFSPLLICLLFYGQNLIAQSPPPPEEVEIFVRNLEQVNIFSANGNLSMAALEDGKKLKVANNYNVQLFITLEDWADIQFLHIKLEADGQTIKETAVEFDNFSPQNIVSYSREDENVLLDLGNFNGISNLIATCTIEDASQQLSSAKQFAIE